VRRDEKQDLAVLAGNKLALKEVTNYRYGRESRRALSSLALSISQDTAHHSRATIWYEHFSLHALSINAGAEQHVISPLIYGMVAGLEPDFWASWICF